MATYYRIEYLSQISAAWWPSKALSGLYSYDDETYVAELVRQRNSSGGPTYRYVEVEVCTDPDKMHGACDGFGGSDYE